MKSFLSTTVLFFVSLYGKAQLLTWSSDFSYDNSSITITVDATKGNQALVGHAASDVYIHTGVITNLSTSPSNWLHVTTTWPATTPSMNCTSLGNNKWSFTIANIRSYYNVPANEQILKIALLFRSADGNVVQRNADGSDMYIPIYASNGAPYARITEPFRTPTYKMGVESITKNVNDNVAIKAISTNATSLVLNFNGTNIATSTTGIVTASSTITAAGLQRIIAIATNGANVHKDTVEFFVAPPVTILPLPSNVNDGINYISNSSVTLVLRAPGKSNVQVIGDFNNWTPSLSSFMNKTPDGKFFWVTLTGLTAGQQYGFQYIVDNTIKTGDPYAEMVLDPFNDQYINAVNDNPNTFPNLKPYPAGLTTGNVSVFQINAPTYNWQTTDFVRPNKKNLIIYELLVRDFVKNHDWKTLTDTLSYFKRMGINAIQIMPLNEFDGNDGWGYNPSYYFAPDKYYGTKNTLKTFIDSCHKNGIAVIMDIAMNHTTGASPLAQLYWNSNTNSPASNNPWLNVSATHPASVHNDFNHESIDTRYYVKRVIEHWLTEYKVDGFRWDLSKGFTQVNSGGDYGIWGNYDASRIAIWKDYYAHHQSVSPGSYCILEHFATNSEEIVLSDNEMMLWGNGWYNFKSAGIGSPSGANLGGAISYTDRGWSKQHIVGYAHSHDEERIMYECLNNGNLSNASIYNPRDTTTAIKRMEALAPFLIAIPGPKMIWQFEELAYPFSINTCENGSVDIANCRTVRKPIRWDYLNDPRRKSLLNVYSKMIELRKRDNYAYENLFVNGSVTKDLSSLVKWINITDPSLSMVVMGNFDVNMQSNQNINFPSTGKWYNYFSGDSIQVTGSTYNVNLAPGEYRVFLTKNLNPQTPTGIGGGITPQILQMKVQIFPNPVTNAGASIKMELPESGNLSLSVISINGQELTSIFKGHKQRGTQLIALQQINGLASGTYLLKTVLNGKVRLDKIQKF